jgi:hypothetical protein
MQRLEVSCTVRLIYTSLGAKGLRKPHFSSIESTLKSEFPVANRESSSRYEATKKYLHLGRLCSILLCP